MARVGSELKRRVRSPKVAKVIKSISAPMDRFLQLESAGGVLLIFASLIAMIWANSPFYEAYEHFIHTPVTLSLGNFKLDGTFHHWVNDGLMAIFFYVVGLEIKRELVIGELSTSKKAALPMLAAIGGMVVPAFFYIIFNFDGPGARGWGIPMATDIAFAVGILTLMSRKVPFALKIFLLALAIVDDLGAVLVIAFFYTEQLNAQAMGLGALCFALIVVFRISGIRNMWIFLALSVIAWHGVLESGIHATIAGVVLGFLTPLKSYYIPKEVSEKISDLSTKIRADIASSEENSEALMAETEHHVSELAYYAVGTQSPLERAIHNLHPWVTFIIMPLFALVNAGVRIEDVSLGEFFAHPVALGVILGLFVGKPLGVLGSCYLAIKAGIAELPQQVTWRHMSIVGVLAGVGFTMALFVSNLAITSADQEVYSKLGILIGSALSGLIGLGLLITSKDIKSNR